MGRTATGPGASDEPLITLHGEGLTTAEIARRLGRPYTTVRHQLQRLGLTPHRQRERDGRLQIRVSALELRAIQRAAEERGETVSDYVRGELRGELGLPR